MRRQSSCVWLVITVLVSACAQNPEIAKRKYFESGNQYFANKQYAEATLQYSNALHQDPQFGQARLKLADAYRALGNMKAAFPEYIRAADLLPDETEAQLVAGNLLV